jgi:hypothetical protein
VFWEQFVKQLSSQFGTAMVSALIKAVIVLPSVSTTGAMQIVITKQLLAFGN